jgi:hypothetical protein
MGRMSAFRFLLFLGLTASLPGAAQPAKAKCSVVLVDVEAAKAFFENPPANATPEELQASAGKFVRVLGELQPDSGEDVLTTKTYPLPGTYHIPGKGENADLYRLASTCAEIGVSEHDAG